MSVLKVNIPISCLAQVDKHTRVRCAIRARINGLSKQFKVLGSPISAKYALELELEQLNILLNRLVTSNVVCNTSYREVFEAFKSFPKSIEEHSLKLFGRYIKSKYDPMVRVRHLEAKLHAEENQGLPEAILARSRALLDREKDTTHLMDKFMKDSEQAVKSGRKSELLRRLLIEVEARSREGWYVVFNTLTVAPHSMSKVFPSKVLRVLGTPEARSGRVAGSRSTAWTDYVRAVDRFFGQAAFGTYRNAMRERAKGNEYHTYFAVIEKGGENGRFHIHVLHVFKVLPSSCSDPNYGVNVPYNREIDALKKFWKLGTGFSAPIAVRFSYGDSFGRKGWRWPVELNKETKQYEPIKANPVGSVCGYVSKYITKSYFNKDENLWRTRISRKMGALPLSQKIQKMSKSQKLTFLQNPQLKLQEGSTRCPRILTKRLILKSLTKNGTGNMILQSLSDRAWLVRPENMFSRVQSLIRGTLVCSLQKAGDIGISSMREKGVSSRFKASNWSMSIPGVSYAS